MFRLIGLIGGFALGVLAAGVTFYVVIAALTTFLPDSYEVQRYFFGSWVACSAASGVLAALAWRGVSPFVGIAYLLGFMSAIYAGEWAAHGLNEAYDSGSEYAFAPHVELYLPVLAAFTFAVLVLELRASRGASAAPASEIGVMPKPERDRPCPRCGKPVPYYTDRCYNCRFDFPAGSA